MFSALLLAASLATAVTGSGVAKTDSRTVDAFASIESGGSWNVEVVSGDKVSVTVTGDDNIVPLITTKVKDGKLSIAASEGSINTKLPLVVKVAMPTIATLKLSGAGNASVTDVKASKLGLDTSGAGNLSFRGNADDVGVKSTGAGQVVLVGKAKSLAAEANGAGNIDASAFEVATATVKCTGAGNVGVNATTSLDVTVTGAGNVVYAGNPKLAKRVSGAGTVRASTDPSTKSVKDVAKDVKDAVVEVKKEAPKVEAKKPKIGGGW
jgi:hypothetical protein